jgi:hypothetical protein
MLENKPKKVVAMSLFPRFKVIDTIDLSQFDKKPPAVKPKKEKLAQNKGSWFWNDGVWSWEMKIKTVKITGGGKVRFPKIGKICPDNSKLTTKKVKTYVKNNFIIRSKKITSFLFIKQSMALGFMMLKVTSSFNLSLKEMLEHKL